MTDGVSITVVRKNKEMLATKAAKAADLKRKRKEQAQEQPSAQRARLVVQPPMPSQQQPPILSQQQPPIQSQQQPPIQSQQQPPIQSQQQPPIQPQQQPPMPSQQLPLMPSQQLPPMPSQQLPPMPSQQLPPMPSQQLPPMLSHLPPMPSQHILTPLQQPPMLIPLQQQPPMPSQHMPMSQQSPMPSMTSQQEQQPWMQVVQQAQEAWHAWQACLSAEQAWHVWQEWLLAQPAQPPAQQAQLPAQNTKKRRPAQPRQKAECQYIDELSQATLQSTAGRCVLIDPGRRDLLFAMHEDSSIEDKQLYRYMRNQQRKETRVTRFKKILKKVKPVDIAAAERSLGAGSCVKPDLVLFKEYLKARAQVADKLTRFYNETHTEHPTSTHQIHMFKTSEPQSFPLHRKLR
ncbi:hypothetical protein J3F81_006174, partial [Coemansia sp. RSA 371]